jgi:hypothetical protein
VSCVPALRSIAHSEAWLLLAAGCHNPGKRISPKLRFLVKFATQAPPAAALPRPRSTPMALQAPELPAGRELMSERWCYFCGRKGKPTRGSSRGRKRVAFVRCGQYSHAIVGVTPHDYERAMAGCICPTHTVSVTYKLGVTTAGMIEVASLLEATEGKRPIAARAVRLLPYSTAPAHPRLPQHN